MDIKNRFEYVAHLYLCIRFRSLRFQLFWTDVNKSNARKKYETKHIKKAETCLPLELLICVINQHHNHSNIQTNRDRKRERERRREWVNIRLRIKIKVSGLQCIANMADTCEKALNTSYITLIMVDSFISVLVKFFSTAAKAKQKLHTQVICIVLTVQFIHKHNWQTVVCSPDNWITRIIIYILLCVEYLRIEYKRIVC